MTDVLNEMSVGISAELVAVENHVNSVTKALRRIEKLRTEYECMDWSEAFGLDWLRGHLEEKKEERDAERIPPHRHQYLCGYTDAIVAIINKITDEEYTLDYDENDID